MAWALLTDLLYATKERGWPHIFSIYQTANTYIHHLFSTQITAFFLHFLLIWHFCHKYVKLHRPLFVTKTLRLQLTIINKSAYHFIFNTYSRQILVDIRSKSFKNVKECLDFSYIEKQFLKKGTINSSNI